MVAFADEQLARVQAQGAGSEVSAPAEIADDLVHSTIHAGDRVAAGYVPLDTRGHEPAHGLHVPPAYMTF